MLAALLLLAPAAEPVAAMEAKSAAAVHETALADFGFETLFNGSDLSGWKVPEGDGGHWRVLQADAGPVIDYDARSEAAGDKSLTTEKSFGDFVLEMEWRVNEQPPVGPTPLVMPDGSYLRDAAGNPVEVPRPNADSGVYIRGTSRAQINIWGWPVGSGEDYGFRHAESNPPRQRAAFTPRLRADRPLGEWNRFTIVAVGDTVTVLLNDQTVLDRAKLPEGTPASGPLTLQHHGGPGPDGAMRPSSSLVQFRNLRIKELPTN